MVRVLPDDCLTDLATLKAKVALKLDAEAATQMLVEQDRPIETAYRGRGIPCYAPRTPAEATLVLRQWLGIAERESKQGWKRFPLSIPVVWQQIADQEWRQQVMPVGGMLFAQVAALDIPPDLTIDKRRLPKSQLKQRGIPSYVGEWVLDNIVPGQGELTEEQAKKVSDWATKVIPGPDDQNLIKSRLLRGDTVKILTPLQIDIILNRRRQERIAKLSLIGIEDAHVSEELDVKYPGLAKQGMWGITELINTPDGVAVASFRPMQATVDLALWKSARREFDLVEWRSLLILSMGYAPEAFTEDEQYLMLCRLLPLVQKNMHLIGFTDDSCAKLGGNVTPGGCGMR